MNEFIGKVEEAVDAMTCITIVINNNNESGCAVMIVPQDLKLDSNNILTIASEWSTFFMDLNSEIVHDDTDTEEDVYAVGNTRVTFLH